MTMLNSHIYSIFEILQHSYAITLHIQIKRTWISRHSHWS